jgi:dihydrofolate reductase
MEACLRAFAIFLLLALCQAGVLPAEETTAMKRICYRVAVSLDGYIAGPNGEADWIVSDPEVNFAEIWAQFDTLLMGRRTYEPAASRLGEKAFQGVKVFVASRTMQPCNLRTARISPSFPS